MSSKGGKKAATKKAAAPKDSAAKGTKRTNEEIEGGAEVEILPEGPVTFVLFGLGRAGTIHANNLLRHPLAKVAYIVELDVKKAEKFCQENEKFAKTKVLHPDDMDVAFKDKNVQAVVCASTTSTHENIIRTAFQYKKPCFTEKPVAESVEKTMEVCKLSNTCGVPLFCGFNRRSDIHFLELKKKVDAGEVGRKMTIKSCSRDHTSNCPIEYLKISGGQFVDQTVHDIDMCMWIAGERPKTVYSMGNAFYPDIAAIKDTDTVTVNLQFPSGVMAQIDNTRRSTFGYDCRLEVYGDKAMVCLENIRPTSVTTHNEEGEKKDLIYNHFSSRFKEAYYSELDHFINFLQGREKKLRITADEAYAAVRVSQAAAQSYREGRVIELDWD